MTKVIGVLAMGTQNDAGLRALINDAVRQVGATVVGLKKLPEGSTFMEPLRDLVERADLVVIDDTVEQPHEVMLFALGVAQAMCKPSVFIVPRVGRLKYEKLAPTATYRYDATTDEKQTRTALAELFQQALDDPNLFRTRQEEKANAAKAFISYCHRDKAYLDRLLVHLGPLVRRGVLDIWDDTKLNAGDVWRDELGKALAEAAIAVLLVSADFLNSNFILDNELPPLLVKAKSEGTVIVPVVLSPCAFTRDEALSAYQAVNRAEPIGGLTWNDQEAVWNEVAQQVERAAGPR